MTKHMIKVPDPHFYRQREHSMRKLNKEEKKSQVPYFMVPRFFDMYHPTTTWLVNVIRTESEKELSRVLMDKESKSLLKFEPNPRAIQANKTIMGGKKDFVITKSKYFQIIDRPEMYCPGESRAPLFNRHAVLYLTPLGLAIYLRKPRAARILVKCVDRDTNKKLIQARQPQFITFMNERFGDLMCMYDHNLAMLNETYDILQSMIQYENWFPMEPYKLVYRKRFVETYLQFDDYMDYAFYVMFTRRSSLYIPGLCAALLKCPSEHFRFNYMCQPSRASKLILLRDCDRIINNCKTYPRRLLRCAFYADKKLKSTMNLVSAAQMFVQNGIFKLVNESAMPFISKPGRRKRLETMPVYRERTRALDVIWPTAYYEFDADCCIALLLALLAKCYRLGKKPTFAATIRLVVKVLGDAGWLNHFDIISDLEFRDYFMGMDDCEKVRFQPEIFSFVRECACITVIDRCHDLAMFFSEERIEQEVSALRNVQDPAVLTRMLMCNDENIVRYVTLDKGEELKAAGTIIGGKRTRGEGRNDPKNKYYMDKLAFPRESTKTVMINTANTEEDSSGGRATSSSEEAGGPGVGIVSGSNSDSDGDSSDDLNRQDLREFLVDAEVVRDPSPRGQQLQLKAPPASAAAGRAGNSGSMLPLPTRRGSGRGGGGSQMTSGGLAPGTIGVIPASDDSAEATKQRGLLLRQNQPRL